LRSDEIEIQRREEEKKRFEFSAAAEPTKEISEKYLPWEIISQGRGEERIGSDLLRNKNLIIPKLTRSD
jgi:hypothetical protein